MWNGVIEGFYGRPWSFAQRIEMLDWIAAAGMSLFAYAPKDDVKLRARWRDLYDDAELAALGRLARECERRGLQFLVAIAPCLDIRYGDPGELDALHRRLDQLRGIGVRLFALLFDDIPSTLSEADARAFPSFAAAQAHVANAAWTELARADPETHLFFCPTEYCGRMAGGDVTRSAYLTELGRTLAPEIEVFWTGPDIVSAEIPVASLREVAAVLRRKPVVWENFHANDYDIRRVHAGPLGGRASDILGEIAGFITNPNCELEADFVAVHTTGRFLAGPGYDETEAAAAARRAWRERLVLAGDGDRHLDEEEIALLMDLCWQPFRCGPEAESLLATARALLAEDRPDVDAAAWRAGHQEVRRFTARVTRLFDRLTELANRDLFYTFQPYVWEAREELEALRSTLDWLATGPAAGARFPDSERLPNTYRRGFTAALQALTPRDRAGRYRHGA